MSELKEGPVTYGQLSVLRSLESYGPAGQTVANLASVWPVPQGFGVAQVMDAWQQLVQAHESLRTTYEERDGTFAQTVHPFRPRPFRTAELADDTSRTAYQAAADLKSPEFDISAGPPWRALVTTYQGEPVYLLTVIHHAAADNGALGVLRQQFDQFLDARDPGPQVQPLDLARAQQDEDRPAEQALAHWVATWGEFLSKDRLIGDVSPRRRATVYSVEALDAARSLSGRLKVSIQSLVLAASVLVMTRLREEPSMTLALMAANRLSQPWASLVSSLNQCAPVTVAVDGQAEVGDFLRAVYYQSLVAYLHGCYDVDALRRGLALAGIQEPDPTFFAKHFNFLGAADEEPEPAAPVRTGAGWRPSAQCCGPDFHVSVAEGNGLFIGVGASEDYLPGNLPAVAAAAIEAALVNMSQQTDASLQDVSNEPIRSV
jgi:hypothetical protein